VRVSERLIKYKQLGCKDFAVGVDVVFDLSSARSFARAVGAEMGWMTLRWRGVGAEVELHWGLRLSWAASKAGAWFPSPEVSMSVKACLQHLWKLRGCRRTVA